MSDKIKTIKEHEGQKYLRTIYSVPGGFSTKQGGISSIEIDVYCVLKAYNVVCPAIGHAVKKLLCAGQRGKGSRKDDLIGVIAAINRAIELNEIEALGETH